MLSEPKWSFDMYLRAAREQRIAAGAHGWRLKLLPWLRNSPIVQQLETHDRVVAAMQVCPPRAAATTHPDLTPSQPGDRADPANLGAEAKSKIAQRSGCTLQQVNSVIKQARPPPPSHHHPAACSLYRPSSPHAPAFSSLQVMASRAMHGWMQRLKVAGRPIPQSHEDMERIATQPDNLMSKAFTRRR